MSQAHASFESHVEKIYGAATVEDVSAAFLAGSATLGFEMCALFSCAGLDHPPRAINFQRLPQVWVDRYFEQKYYDIDPIYSVIQLRTDPFSWDDPRYRSTLTTAQNAILDECGEAGLAGGIAIPIGTPGEWAACCAVVPSAEGVDPVSQGLAHSLATFAHARARILLGDAPSPTRLSQRERECLLLAARGKSDWAIGEMLSLSERTVHHAIERAKKRYGVATRVQAIVHAIAAGEFTAADTMR